MARTPEIRLAGIPVRIEPTFLVVLVLLGLPQSPLRVATWVVIAAVSVLVHELGHAIAFRAYGIKPSIVLHGFGGLTSGSGELEPGQRIVTSLAGPLSALFLFGVPALLLERSGAVPAGDLSVIVRQVVWVNVGWSLLNLAPVLPLDGGQVFRDVCDITTGGRGRRPAEIVSVVVAVGLGLWAFSQGLVLAALFAGWFAAINVNQLRQAGQDELRDRLAGAHRALLEHRPNDARTAVEDILQRRPAEPIRAWATEMLAWAYLMQGDIAGAEAVEREATTSGAVSSSLRGAIALAAGQRAMGLAIVAWAFAHDPPGPPKSLAAVAVGGTGTATEVARELVLMGAEGEAGAVVLRDLLVYAGYRDAAGDVDAVLASRR